MCSPMIFTGLISAVATIAGTAMQASAANAAANRRAAAEREAAAYQAQKRRDFIRREDEMAARQRQEHSRGLEMIGETPEKREEEETRLTEEFSKPVDAIQNAETTNDALISGTAETGRVVQGNLASELASAANKARGKIGALATLQSYGPSQFGFTNTIADIFQDTGANIDLVNQMRRGNRNVYNMARQIGASDAPVGDLNVRSDIGGTLTGLGSYGLGKTIAGSFGGGAPAGGGIT